jgi:hypothetical protein
MASEMWLAEEEVDMAKDSLIGKYHTHLAEISQDIAIVFKDKASEKLGKKIPGQTKKANKLVNLLAKRELVFVIELANDVWQDLSDQERMALLDRQLCFCAAIEKEDGTKKWAIALPDACYFKAEVQRHGFWYTSGDRAEDVIVNKVFGNIME